MLTTFATALPVFLIVAAGFVVGRTGVLGEGAATALNRFVIWIALPCMMFEIFATTDWKAIWDPAFVAACVGPGLIIFPLGMLIARWLKRDTDEMAVFALIASYSNSAYLGFPLLLLLLGPQSRPLVAVGGMTTMMAQFAVAVILMELMRNRSAGPVRAVGMAVRGLLTNPIIASPLVGLVWWMTGWTVPAPLETFTHLLGEAASPTALAGIGVFLASRPIGAVLADPAVLLLSAVKLVVYPALAAVFALYLLHLPPFSATIAIIIAALPTGTGPFMFAEFYRRDPQIASGTILLTTVISSVTVAVLVQLLGH